LGVWGTRDGLEARIKLAIVQAHNETIDKHIIPIREDVARLKVWAFVLGGAGGGGINLMLELISRGHASMPGVVGATLFGFVAVALAVWERKN